MPAASAQHLIRLPLSRMALGMTALGGLAAVLAGVLVTGVAGDLALRDGALAAAAVAGGIAAGIAFLAMWGRRPVFSWGALIIAGSTLRLAISTTLAATVYVSQGPNKVAFWMAFLAGSFAAMAHELSILMPILRAAGAVAREPRRP